MLPPRPIYSGWNDPFNAPLSPQMPNDGAFPSGDPDATPSPEALKAMAQGPAKKQGFLSRLQNQPGGKDALLAFGAQMLSAPNFWQGMGSGINAYLQQTQSARAAARPVVEDVQGGAFTRKTDPQSGDSVITPNPEVQEYVENTLGIKAGHAQTLQQLRDAGLVDRLKLQFGHQMDIERLRREAESGDRSAMRELQWMIAQLQSNTTLEAARIGAASRRGSSKERLDNKAEDRFGEDATKAAESIAMLDQMDSLLRVGRTGAGPGVLQAAKRNLANMLGMDIAGVNISDQQILTQGYRNLELRAAEAMRGQGQVTEAERRILQQSMPNIQTDPRAAREVIDTLRNVEKRRQQVWEEWNEYDGDEGFREFTARRYRDLVEDRPRTRREDSSRKQTSSGVSWRIVN